MSATVRSLIGTPGGGLTSRRARDLMRPAAALRDFTTVIIEGRATWPMTDSKARELLDTINSGRPWVVDATQEFLDYVAWFKTLPAMREAIYRQPLDRPHRLALTARLYVEAVQQGHPNPRKRVAEVTGRLDGAIRDDLHAARVEEPQLLTAVRQGRSGGELTPAALRLLEELS